MSEETKVEEIKELTQVEAFLKSQPEGATAVKIAEALGLSLEADSKKSTLTKVRRLARKVVDSNGGDRTQKDGKEKIYKL